MIYGEQKVKEMLRSILPSKARKGFRDLKRGMHRLHRRNVRNALHVADLDCDHEDIYKQDFKRRRETSMLVVERRSHDKITHFVKWAEATTKKMGIDSDDLAAKRTAFIAHIGGADDVIRAHALGHFIHPNDLNPLAYRVRESRFYWTRGKSERKIAQIAARIEEIFEYNHCGLNNMFKAVGLRSRHCGKASPCMSGFLHRHHLCRNRLLLLSKKDIDVAARAIYNGGVCFSTELHSNETCKRILSDYLGMEI